MGKRKERSPEEQERRAKIRELLELSGVSSMTDIQELFKVAAPVIKCKKTPRKKCSFMAEEAKKR